MGVWQCGSSHGGESVRACKGGESGVCLERVLYYK